MQPEQILLFIFIILKVKNGCVELRRNLGHGNTAVSGDSQGVIDDALAKEAKDMNEIINTFRFVD